MRHVILCHGWDGRTNLGPVEWATLAPLLMDAGYEVWALSLGQDNIANAALIATLVDTFLPEDTVDIVAHSMGGLSSRHYLKFMAGHERVGRYIALDTPQYGVPWLKAALFGNMQLWSGGVFLANLNSPDPTAGATTYIQLTCDYTKLLPGVRWKALAGVEHRNMVVDPATLQLVLRILEGDLSELAVN